MSSHTILLPSFFCQPREFSSKELTINMPIQPSLKLEPISDNEFADIDKEVMRCAYSVQNKFGRLFDESVYENDLAARLRAEGFEVHTQVPILVTHADFFKTYYLDLVVDRLVYEMKVVANLTGDHVAQCLHYAMLQDVSLVKLINFGEKRVRGKLLRIALSTADRYQPIFQRSGMHTYTPNCERLFNYLVGIINDWGTHLSSQLYNEGLVYLFGGETNCIKRVELRSGGVRLGTHRVQYYAEDLAFVVTSLARDQSAYEQHLNVLLTHTKLKAIKWINLNHACVDITTVGSLGSKMKAKE
jgi:GxxExxY protein